MTWTVTALGGTGATYFTGTNVTSVVLNSTNGVTLSGVVAGNSVAVLLNYGSATAASSSTVSAVDSAGSTWLFATGSGATDATNQQTSCILYCLSMAGTPTSITVTIPSAGFDVASAIKFTNSSGTPSFRSAIGAIGTGLALSSGALTNSIGDLIVGLGETPTRGDALVAGTGFTVGTAQSADQASDEYTTSTSGAASANLAVTMSVSPSQAWIMVGAAFAPPAGQAPFAHPDIPIVTAIGDRGMSRTFTQSFLQPLTGQDFIVGGGVL